MRRIPLIAVVLATLILLLPTAATAAADWSWPVRGDVVTKYRNGDDPYAAGQHRGVDIAAPAGADVVAATAGRVVFAGTVGSSGLTVTVRSGDGRFDLSHLHLSAAGVREGDVVGRGDRLGAVGVSGRRSVDTPHLHFGVREAGSDHAYRDPLDFLPPLARPAARPDPPLSAPEPAPVSAPPAAAPVARAPSVASAPDPVPAAAPAPAPLPAGATAGQAVALPAAVLADGPVAGVQLDPRGSSPAAVRSRDVAAAASPSVAAPARSREAPSQRTPAAARDLGVGPRAAREPAGAVAVREHRPRAAAAPRPGRGFDAGWLAALVGLVATATCLGNPGPARRAARGGRTAVLSTLRPLLGRG